jgi:hypothetical protein
MVIQYITLLGKRKFFALILEIGVENVRNTWGTFSFNTIVLFSVHAPSKSPKSKQENVRAHEVLYIFNWFGRNRFCTFF